jgi:hypothetical protein
LHHLTYSPLLNDTSVTISSSRDFSSSLGTGKAFCVSLSCHFDNLALFTFSFSNSPAFWMLAKYFSAPNSFDVTCTYLARIHWFLVCHYSYYIDQLACPCQDRTFMLKVALLHQ